MFMKIKIRKFIICIIAVNKYFKEDEIVSKMIGWVLRVAINAI